MDELLTRLHPIGRLLASFATIRLEWKLMVVENALAYFDSAKIRSEMF